MNLNIRNCINAGIFSWHGTSLTSIDPICKEGFDPRKRSGQAHGQGEYFGLSPQVSLGYCKNSNLMIVAFLIKSKIINTVANFCHVVNNPLNFEQSYCLPVLIVNFGQNKINNLLNLNYESQSNVIVKVPNMILFVKWQWEMDGGNFESFKDSTQEIIEIKYNEFLLDSTKNFCDIGGLVRYNDDKVANYIIDFKSMKQINQSTLYTRMIRRTNIDESYESQVQAQIENEFRLYVQGRRSNKYVFRFAPRPEQYEIDFINMSQTNLTTYTTRRIKRV
ncbi:unnamed protein product [Brachionus calyciflorus]|uniref:WWE domain-containing protein n=1 Tax=Brachionus calyciflorus TaxID=104777 RepID=A0A814FVP3_9BILA|nr:unnamed protein product [Brachionus calyciflorus]